MHETCQSAPPHPAKPQVLELIASGFGSVGALVSLLSVPFCSGLEAATKPLGALAQNIAGVAVEIVRQGE